MASRRYIEMAPPLYHFGQPADLQQSQSEKPEQWKIESLDTQLT